MSKKVEMVCPTCHRTRVVTEKKNSRGICRDCSLKELHKDQSRHLRKILESYLHPSGATILPDDRRPGPDHKMGRPYQWAYLCANCGKKDYAWATDNTFKKASNGTFKNPEWHGLCKSCKQKLGGNRRLHGDRDHKSGAIVHLDVRHPEDTRKVAFTCANKLINKCEREEDDFVSISTTSNDDWQGLCADCFPKYGNPTKKVKDQPLHWPGMFIHFAERVGEDVPVDCYLCARIGKDKRWLTSAAAISEAQNRNKREGTEWDGFCPTHRNNGVATARAFKHILQSDQLMTVDGNKQQRRGRKPGTFGFDHNRFPIEVNNFILEIWEQHHLVSRISREAVAEKFQASGENIQGRDVTARLKICGIIENWPEYRERVIQGQINS